MAKVPFKEWLVKASERLFLLAVILLKNASEGHAPMILVIFCVVAAVILPSLLWKKIK